MRTKSLFHPLSLVLTLTLLLALPFPVFASKPASVNVQILAINDFHGALDPALTQPTATPTDKTTKKAPPLRSLSKGGAFI